MQIYDSQHNTTLITDQERYYHCDGLNMAVLEHVTHLHHHLRQWYGTSSEMPPVLQTHTLEVLLLYTLRQTHGWTCAMHMVNEMK